MKGSQIKWMCHLVKWRGQKIVKSREAWESLTFIRTPPLSPSLPFLAILANIFSDIHLCSLPAVNFLVAAIMTVCLGIGGEGGMEGCTAGESITGEYGFVFSSLFCLKFLQDEYISQFCRSNICFHSFRWDVHLYFFLVRCWMLSVCSGAPHSLNSRDQYL